MKLTPDQEFVRQKLIDRVQTVGATLTDETLGDLLVTYKEVADWLGPCSSMTALNVGNAVLDFINISENHECRPMLSAIVVNSQTRRPGDRFFDTARFLEVLKEGGDE